jgi:hypothetical protein
MASVISTRGVDSGKNTHEYIQYSNKEMIKAI